MQLARYTIFQYLLYEKEFKITGAYFSYRERDAKSEARLLRVERISECIALVSLL